MNMRNIALGDALPFFGLWIDRSPLAHQSSGSTFPDQSRMHKYADLSRRIDKFVCLQHCSRWLQPN